MQPFIPTINDASMSNATPPPTGGAGSAIAGDRHDAGNAPHAFSSVLASAENEPRTKADLPKATDRTDRDDTTQGQGWLATEAPTAAHSDDIPAGTHIGRVVRAAAAMSLSGERECGSAENRLKGMSRISALRDNADDPLKSDVKGKTIIHGRHFSGHSAAADKMSLSTVISSGAIDDQVKTILDADGRHRIRGMASDRPGGVIRPQSQNIHVSPLGIQHSTATKGRARNVMDNARSQLHVNADGTEAAETKHAKTQDPRSGARHRPTDKVVTHRLVAGAGAATAIDGRVPGQPVSNKDGAKAAGVRVGGLRRRAGKTGAATPASETSDRARTGADRVLVRKTDAGETAADGTGREAAPVSHRNDPGSVETAGQKTAPDTDPTALKENLLKQIVDRASIQIRNGQQDIQIDLKPEHLGHLRIQVHSDHHSLSVRLTAETAMAKELIESHLVQLKANMAHQGLGGNHLHVDVSLSDGSGQQNPGQAHGQAPKGPAPAIAGSLESTTADIQSRATASELDRLNGSQLVGVFA